MMNISKGKKSSAKFKSMGDHDVFLSRITKSLYYSKLPMTDCLSLPVTELAAELFTEVKCGRTLDRLDVEEASRISRNACVSPCSLVLALLYLERLKDCNPEYLQRVAPSELFLVSLMVASKFLHDDGEDDEVFNAEWAQSGDVTLSRMNHLEKDFLFAIDWAIYVENQDFWERLQRLEKDIAYKEAQKRGWFSYTELCSLMDTVRLAAVMQVVVSVSSICLATYAAGVVTLLGSALVASHLPGTLLTPGQSPDSGESVEAELIPILERELSDRSAVSDEDLADDVALASLNCNNSCTSCYNFEDKNDTRRSAGSEWWLSSIMNWLPRYSGLDPTLTVSQALDKDELDRVGAFITNAKSVRGSDRVARDAVSLITEINWKETLSLDLEFPLHDWRHYVSYLAKASLDHRH